MRKFLQACAALLVLALYGCGGTGVDFIIVNTTEPQSLDPHLVEGGARAPYKHGPVRGVDGQ